MRSHHGASRGRRDALAGWWPAEHCIAAPLPVDRHRNLSMAITLVALTLLFLALAMFGPAQPGSAEQATAGSTEFVTGGVAVEVIVVEPGPSVAADAGADVAPPGAR